MAKCVKCGKQVSLIDRKQIYNEETEFYDYYCPSCFKSSIKEKESLKKEPVREKVIEVKKIIFINLNTVQKFFHVEFPLCCFA